MSCANCRQSSSSHCALAVQVDDLGSWGYVAYTFVYTALELVIIPAIPLTMAAGALFGVAPGVVVVSLASTAAAALGFLITRYAARDKVCRVRLLDRCLDCLAGSTAHRWFMYSDQSLNSWDLLYGVSHQYPGT